MPKPDVGQDPPPSHITDLLCQEQWHRLGSLVIYDAKKLLQVSKKTKQNGQKKLGYPLPAPPFPMEIQRRKKTLSKALSGLGDRSRKEKRSTATAAKKVTLGATLFLVPKKRVKEQAASVIKAGR